MGTTPGSTTREKEGVEDISESTSMKEETTTEDTIEKGGTIESTRVTMKEAIGTGTTRMLDRSSTRGEDTLIEATKSSTIERENTVR